MLSAHARTTKNMAREDTNGPPRRQVGGDHGAGSGIGRAASLIFTKEGAKLIAVDKTDAVIETVKLVREAGGTAEAIQGDAGVEQDVAGFIGKAVSAYGKLDVIWANAGISGGWVTLHTNRRAVARDPAHQPDRAFLAIKHASLQMMKQERGGSIICTASVAGLKANAGGRPTARARLAWSAWCRPQHMRSARHPRQRDLPGLIETGMTRNTFEKSARSRARKTRSARSTRRSAAASRTKLLRWGCSLPATRRPTSTDRLFRSMED